MSITFGPVLNLRQVTSEKWRVSAIILIAQDESLDNYPLTLSAGTIEHAVIIAAVPLMSPLYQVVRYEFSISLSASAQKIAYSIGDEQYAFFVPAANNMPAVAYVSCNGFSSEKLMKDVDDKYNRWRDINNVHQNKPFHILMMGGDQIYSDSIWHDSAELASWAEQWGAQRWQTPFSGQMAKELDGLFFKIYCKAFTQQEIGQALSAIPTIMMWDDHDIMDGWGSYPPEKHNSPVWQGIFHVAERYFRIFQLQISPGGEEQHPAALPGVSNYCLGYRQMGKLSILVADLRKQRSPRPMQIMSADNWDAFYQWLDAVPDYGHLLLQSSIPVAWLNLNKLELLLNVLPGQQELEDDLRDHWRSEAHAGERKRLIHRLLDYTRRSQTRVTIVSGDVHIAASAVIESDRYPAGGFAVNINQLISTGVVHPAPPAFVRYMLEKHAQEVETIENGITAHMIPVTAKGHYLIGERNWLSLEPDDKSRLWASWHVEFSEQPLSRVIHPANYQ